MTLNRMEKHAQAVAIAASTKKPVTSDLLQVPHEICGECDGTGIQNQNHRHNPWDHLCSHCGGRGVVTPKTQRKNIIDFKVS